MEKNQHVAMLKTASTSLHSDCVLHERPKLERVCQISSVLEGAHIYK